MLYQLRPQLSAARPLSRLFATVAGVLASLLKRRADLRYLDGMRRSELEELGLRRTEHGSYRSFGD